MTVIRNLSQAYPLWQSADAKDMCTTEYHEAVTMGVLKEDGREEGVRLFIMDK